MSEEQMQYEGLPEVGGRRIECSLAEFERRTRFYLGEEQRKISPDNALIAVLCDAVRLAREYADSIQNECPECGSAVPHEMKCHHNL